MTYNNIIISYTHENSISESLVVYLEYIITLETVIPKITSKTVNSAKTPATVPTMTSELGTR